MDLGTFSISLTVQDIAASRAFYEKIGFQVIDGNQEDNWLVLQSDTATIGLFQGMFDKNILTFNPIDVRAIQTHVKGEGITPVQEAEGDSGAASMVLIDPDGNPILFDQHND